MDKKFYNNLVVSSAPHIVSPIDTSKIMAMVIMALMPSLLVSVYVFGLRVIALTAVCVVSAVAFEYIWNKLNHKTQTVSDCSAALTGLLIAMNCPAGLPYWIAILGTFVAIIIVKQLYGGIGKNIVNPAITARIVMFISFATEMTTWPLPKMAADTTSTATPLGVLGAISEGATGVELPSNMDLFLGFVGGSLGEVSAIALLLGGLFLIWKKVISPIIPFTFIGTVFVFAFVYYSVTGTGDPLQMAVFHILAGGVMLGAFFMGTDYVTSPLLPMGKVIMGVGCGVITMVIRLFASFPEGVSFSILLMNCLTPLINDFCQKRMYGGAKKNEK